MTYDVMHFWGDPGAEACEILATEVFSSLSNGSDPAEQSTRYFSLPGISLTVHCVGTATGTLLTAAFAHLETPRPTNTGKALLWRIGDASLGTADPEFPPPPQPKHDLGNFNTSEDGRLFIERRRGMVTVYDHKTGVVTSICENAGALENDVIAKPLLRFLIGILQQQGIYLAHAALVGRNGRGMLVTGKGGMGKSTISSVALGQGLSFCSDDFVALERDADGVIGHSLYGTLLLHPDQIERHPHFKENLRLSTSDFVPKAVVVLGEAFKQQTVARLRLDAMAVPQITAQAGSELRPMSRIAALRALTPTSVFSSPWREVEHARFLMGLATDLPCFTYLSGSDFSRICDPIKSRYA